MNNTNTHIPTSEKAAASYIPKVVLENFIRSTVQAAYIYELVDNPDNPAGTDQEAHFGLVRSDWSKKPAYVALALMLNALKDSGAQTFTLNPIQMEVKGPPDMKTVLLARSDGSYQLVAWRTVEVWDRQGQKDIPCTDVEVGVRFAKKASGRCRRWAPRSRSLRSSWRAEL
jgi:hypothetical protein